MKPATTHDLKCWPSFFEDVVSGRKNFEIIYPRSLAQYLGREDLKIVPPSFVARERLYGLEKEIIIDHAVSWHRALSAEQWEVLRYYEQRLRVIKGASK